MRIIDSNHLGSSGLAQTGRAGEVDSSTGIKSHQSAKSGSSDTVQLSGFADRISSGLQADSASRAQRVSELAVAVQSGAYKVDAQAVSRAIVDRAIEAGNSKL